MITNYKIEYSSLAAKDICQKRRDDYRIQILNKIKAQSSKQKQISEYYEKQCKKIIPSIALSYSYNDVFFIYMDRQGKKKFSFFETFNVTLPAGRSWIDKFYIVQRPNLSATKFLSSGSSVQIILRKHKEVVISNWIDAEIHTAWKDCYYKLQNQIFENLVT